MPYAHSNICSRLKYSKPSTTSEARHALVQYFTENYPLVKRLKIKDHKRFFVARARYGQRVLYTSGRNLKLKSSERRYAMLKVVFRNFQPHKSKEKSSNNSSLKVEKKSSCSSVNVNSTYWDLANKHVVASNILSDKTNAWIKAEKEYREAYDRAQQIYKELKSIEKLVTKI